LWSPVLAQTAKRRETTNRKPPVATTHLQPVAQPTQPSSGPISLVTVNGQTFTTADLEPALRQELEHLEFKIAAARKNVLDLQINTMLLQLEAKRRGIDSQRLYELEVSSRVPAITPAEIKKFIDDNGSQFEGIDPAVINQQVAAYLRDEAENKLADELVSRLRKTNAVGMGVDVNSPVLNNNSVVATVAGQPLKADALLERLKPIIYRMKLEAYEVAKKRTDQLVDDLLLLDEAKRRQLGPEEIIRTQISDKLGNPTEDEIARFYSENKARIAGDLNGIGSTPTIFINGVQLKTLSAEGLREAIDRATANPVKSKSSQ